MGPKRTLAGAYATLKETGEGSDALFPALSCALTLKRYEPTVVAEAVNDDEQDCPDAVVVQPVIVPGGKPCPVQKATPDPIPSEQL